MGSALAGDELIERLVRAGVGAGWRVTAGPVWLMAMPVGQVVTQQGWKLHVSSRAAGLVDLIEVIVPVLAAERCAFKVARSPRVLTGLNDGLTSPTSVGKAVTVYPDPGRVRELGLELAGLLRGRRGPRVLSDRRVAAGAPVYYRYGPFATGWEADARGWLAPRLHGPAGEVLDGAATLEYRQPPWVTDPFTGQAGDQRPAAATLGGHYQLTDGLRQAAQGNIYRAVDLRDGSAVVVKEARALVAEHGGQVDTRMRMRNERRVLQALDGVAGIPRFIDHFRNGDDEFLVTTDCGPASLPEDVLRNGLYPVAGVGSRSLAALAGRLARILHDLHERGVIMRDLSPKNVVIGDAGASIVDFGLSAYDGLHLPGATAGYAPPRQWRDEPPAAADDYFALGMTVLYAASGLEPVSADDDPGLPQARALQTLRRDHGPVPEGLIALIADLISGDDQAARAAFECLARGQSVPGQSAPGQSARSHGPARPLPAFGEVSAQLAAEVSQALLEDLLGHVENLLNDPPAQPAAHDASVYQGSSGIGLELLHHLSRSRTAPLVAGLAAFTVRAAERVKLPPGLFTGTTGASVFLTRAAAQGIAVPAAPWDSPGPGWQPEGDDLIVGAAGIGLGHLWLYRGSGDPAHLRVAQRCHHAIVARTIARSPFLAGAPPAPGIDPAAGRAHGLAGITEFLITFAGQADDQSAREAAARSAAELARHASALLPDVNRSTAAPLAVSWCQGLAGIGQALLHASITLQDDSLAALAYRTAETAMAYLPRLSLPTRCCGAAGVGHFLIDLALTSQDDRYWQAAGDVATHMLLRSSGPPSRPRFIAVSPHHAPTSWAFGIPGQLSFFRRLAIRGGPDSTPLWTPG